ncbi:MAG: peptidoglycan-binding domain-containing protein, partial [Cardiobacteriaceae bacterium]|nr:peptidoglycan-binding domain-containing protein [Cardiobacteriaceae bacterium]
MNRLQTLLLLALPLWAHAYPTSDTFDCDTEKAGIFQAARENKINILERYQKNRCNLAIADQRGFTAYDHAALAGNAKLADWLVQNGIAKSGEHSTALLKLVQTGLRFLNLDAGVIDGHMNAATKDGIIMFQKAHKLKVDGKLTPEWLGVFNKALAKKMQNVLGQLGYAAGSADGIIGQNTRSAMQAFRQERAMPQADYANIDDQLLYQLMMAENEANKKAIAKRDAERQARRIAQEAAARQELARKQREVQRRAAEQRARAEAAAQAAHEQRLAEERQLAAERQRQQQAQQAAQQQAAAREAEAQAQRQIEAARLAEAMAAAEKRAQQEKDAQAIRELQAQMEAIEAQRRAQEQAAAEAERQREEARQAAEMQRLVEKQRQEKAAAERRAAEQRAEREAEAAR